MERRRHRRLDITIPIQVFSRGELLAVVDGLEISPTGMSIGTPGVRLIPHQVVTLNFCGAGITCLTRAMVIYNNARRTGLMFSDSIPRRCLVPEGRSHH